MHGKIFIYIVIIALMNAPCDAILNFRSSSSGIKVKEGAGLVLSNRIQECRGKVVKANGAFIGGREIVFNKGLFVDGNAAMKIVGTYKSGADNKILLDGDKKFRGNGISVAQAIEVRNHNNRLEGEILLSNNVVLYDTNASLTCAIVRSLSKDIELNGGKLFLEENLSFIDDKKILGNGTVACNGRKIVLGAKEMTWNGSIYFDNGNDIELKSTLHLAQTWTFSGNNSTIIGNGNILVLENHGKIVIERGSNLLIKGIIIKNVSNGNITCIDNASNISFQDVVLVQNGEYRFNKGTFDVTGFLDLTGSQTFVLQPSAASVIGSASTLFVESNMTLSVDFAFTNSDALIFEDSNSVLSLSNCSLFVTATGLHLKKGKVIIDGVVDTYLESKIDPLTQRAIEGGITLGDLSLSNDFVCQILGGAQWNIKHGWFIYKNIDATSWRMSNALSTLRIDQNSVLKLYQPISFLDGRLRMADVASFLQEGSNYLDCSVEIFKSV